jgi:hypothetical protein
MILDNYAHPQTPRRHGLARQALPIPPAFHPDRIKPVELVEGKLFVPPADDDPRLQTPWRAVASHSTPR